MLHSAANLSAAAAYNALQGVFEEQDDFLDAASELQDRVIGAPIASFADAIAKSRLLAELLSDEITEDGRIAAANIARQLRDSLALVSARAA